MRNMRKWFIMLSVLSLFFLVGCELETTDNGDLDGYWHLERVDSLSSQRSVDYGQALSTMGKYLSSSGSP